MAKGTGRWFIAAMLGAVLLGCTVGGRHHSELQETLSIDIRPNASKLFVYQLRAPEGEHRPLVKVYRTSAQVSEHRRREPLGNREYRQLRRDTERAVTLTGYCREGFLELDYRLSRAEMWYRGECRESATAEDRARFAGQGQLPIPQPE